MSGGDSYTLEATAEYQEETRKKLRFSREPRK